jgi:predicted nucleotidyltransferase
MNQLIESNLTEIKSLLAKYDIDEAYLFGSATSDKFTDASDVDFLIKFKTGIDYVQYSDNYFALLYAMQDLLKREVDLVAEETLSNPYLIASINKSKVKLI